MFTGSFFSYGEHALDLAMLKGNTSMLSVKILQCRHDRTV